MCMRVIRAQLSVYPKWLTAVFIVFVINFVLAVTIFLNFTLMVANLAMLFTAYSIREYKYNKIYFSLCLLLSISFVILAVMTYPI
ncbi:unknown protein [Paenibacillus amylolyticus]|uniref:Uncharacterized protein n=1 Tax=Paenibacillus amylolyticus TaxID=1451 RepID=A0A100VTX6_PAEAM|nr:unknown protein [Paenibacillus amylolyticus]